MGREIKWSAAFKRDLKRERKTDRQVNSLLRPVLMELTLGKSVGEKLQGPRLDGSLKTLQGMPHQADLPLVYDCPDDETLLLVRLASHAELGLT